MSRIHPAPVVDVAETWSNVASVALAIILVAGAVVPARPVRTAGELRARLTRAAGERADPGAPVTIAAMVTAEVVAVAANDVAQLPAVHVVAPRRDRHVRDILPRCADSGVQGAVAGLVMLMQLGQRTPRIRNPHACRACGVALIGDAECSDRGARSVSSAGVAAIDGRHQARSTAG